MEEIRSVAFEMRATGDGLTLAGYAAVFNSPTTIYERGREFVEEIAPGAFSRTINAKDRLVMQFDHGTHPFFGSLPIGSITDLREDGHGLYVEARLTDSWFTEPIRTAIANEAVTGMSFRFSVPDGGDTWDRSGPVAKRTITEAKLYELGPVVSPAYEATTVGVRSALGLLTQDERDDVLRQITDPAENAVAVELIDQIKQLAAQLVELEASALVAGDDTASEIQTVIGMLMSLDYLASEEADDTDMGDNEMNAATPDEGSPRHRPATPDEGSRIRTPRQRRALLALHNL